MGWGQRIASIALLLLALIAALALLTRGSGSGSSSGDSASSGSTFAPQSYTDTSPASGGTRHRSGKSSGSLPTSGTGDNAGLGTIAYAQLPREAKDTVNRIDAGGPFPYSRDGVVFGNFERQLPQHPRGWYHEYTVKTPGASTRGARRIITGQDGAMYYTADHYQTFKQVQR